MNLLGKGVYKSVLLGGCLFLGGSSIRGSTVQLLQGFAEPLQQGKIYNYFD